MTQTLDYAPPTPRDLVSTSLGATTWILIFLGPIASIFAENWHNGLRSIPVYADLQTRDVLATAITCGLPLLGLLFRIILIWRCRKTHRVGMIWGAMAIFFHAMHLYNFGRLEFSFWSL